MSVKRSRVDSSSSSRLDVPLVKADEPSRSKSFSISSPRIDDSDDELSYSQQKVGGFLEQCYYCKMRIAPNSEVFMHSNLCAFCSVECRDTQIVLDQLVAKQPENTKKRFSQEQESYTVEG